VCSCTVKHLLHRSWTGSRRARCHHLESLLSPNEAFQDLVDELTERHLPLCCQARQEGVYLLI
jgi:hypothetical protein